MTSTAAESQVRLIGGDYQVPRVNLIPAEIAEEAQFRSLRALLGLVVLLAVLVVGFLWWSAKGSLSDAQEGVTAAEDAQVALQTDIATYADVPAVYAEVAAAEAQLEVAMGQEVRYSFVLSDLSLSVPEGVWLQTMTVNQPLDGDGTGVTGTFGTPGIASVTMGGTTLGYRQVANWLHVLGQSYYVDPALTDVHAAEPIGEGDDATPVYDFTGPVLLGPEAYSNRYNQTGSTP